MSFFNFPIPAPPNIPTDSVYRASKISSLYPIETLGPYTSWKLPVVAATTVDISLSGTPIIDGVTLALGDRVLVKNQVNGAENGIYVVNAQAWFRANDLGKDTNASALCVFVNEGTVSKNTAFLCSNQGPCIVGIDALTFIAVAGSGFSLSPGGVNTNVQFNNAGTFGGTNNFTYVDAPNPLLTVAGTITGLVAPTNPADAANKAYVDAHSGAPAGLNTQVQYNNAGAFGASSSFTFDPAGTNPSIPFPILGQMTVGLDAANLPPSTAFNITAATPTTAAPWPGGSLAISGGNPNGDDRGGDLILSGGLAGANAGSGDVYIQTFTGGLSKGSGSVLINTGSSTVPFVSSGLVDIKSGNVVNGLSGDIDMNSGHISTTGNSGDIGIYSGSLFGGAGSGNTGTVSLYSGANNGVGNSGEVFVRSGQATNGGSGMVSFYSGDVATGDSGDMFLTTGSSALGAGGDISITSGIAPAGIAGSVTVTAGIGLTNGDLKFVVAGITYVWPTTAPNLGDKLTVTNAASPFVLGWAP